VASLRVIPVLLLWLSATACSSSQAGPTIDAGTGGLQICVNCLDAADERSDLARVTGVIDQTCSNPDGCHGSGAENLSLTVGHEFTALLGVPSTEVPSLFRVLPGDPAQSYLYMKLACEGGIQGSCMPGGGHLPQALVQSFHDWIEAGAPTQ
jgi:hypothetical protein